MKKKCAIFGFVFVFVVGCSEIEIDESSKKDVVQKEKSLNLESTEGEQESFLSQSRVELVEEKFQDEVLVLEENPEFVEEDDSSLLFEKLCTEKESLHLLDYEGLPGKKGGEIYRCGDFVKVRPPSYLMDAPGVMFDLEGAFLGFCGGKPSKSKVPDFNGCEIDCETTGLHLCFSRQN